MPAYRDEKTGNWMARYSYKTWDGKVKQSKKRGFKTKREAVEWERSFLLQQSCSNDMVFEQFVDIYLKDIKNRIKRSTYDTKVSIIDKCILPYFSEKRLNEITTTDILKWQNEMLGRRHRTNGKPYAKSYLKTIHNQFSAILNHAVRFYQLSDNPARIVGNMGSEKEIKMKFWTQEEYQLFSEAMMEKPISYYCFEVLYWGGLRLGEMLALTPADISFESKEISVNKTYRRSKGIDYVTEPKTPTSVRRVVMPDFLAEELKEYLDSCYALSQNERLFPVTKGYIEREMQRGIAQQQLTRIRVHDLRHSHVSLLINMGYSAVAIAERMGHESIDITYRYAHMFPTVQTDMAKKLNNLKGEIV